MKLVVCVKQVPEITNVRVNPETGTLIREGVASGEFPSRADLRRSADMTNQAFVSLFHPPLILQCAEVPERAGPEELAEFVIRALRCP